MTTRDPGPRGPRRRTPDGGLFVSSPEQADGAERGIQRYRRGSMAKAFTLADNFGDDSIDSRWISFGNPAPATERVRETNGRIEVRPASGTTGYSGLVSAGTYDLTNSQFSAELVRTLRAVPAAQTLVRAKVDDNNLVHVLVSGGTLYCTAEVAGATTDHAVLPYDPRLHRFVRLRDQAGTLYWEASPDG